MTSRLETGKPRTFSYSVHSTIGTSLIFPFFKVSVHRPVFKPKEQFTDVYRPALEPGRLNRLYVLKGYMQASPGSGRLYKLYILKGYTVQASPATWKAIQVVYPERGYTVKASPGTWKAIQVVYPESLYRPALESGRLYRLYKKRLYP